MSESTVGHCLHLYLENFSVFWTLEEIEEQKNLPAELKEDESTLASFRERASEQAVTLLEGLFSGLLCGSSPVPYRTDRRSQRRTVRNDWHLEGRLYRPRERVARTHWSFCLGEIKKMGPAVCLVLKTHEPASTVAMDRLATLVAASAGLESANARDCFVHDSGYDSGVLAAAVPLRPDQTHPAVLEAAASQLKLFFQDFREKFEEAIEA